MAWLLLSVSVRTREQSMRYKPLVILLLLLSLLVLLLLLVHIPTFVREQLVLDLIPTVAGLGDKISYPLSASRTHVLDVMSS